MRKNHKKPIPDINFIESTPSPVLKGNHEDDYFLIENGNDNENTRQSEIKIDELNVQLANHLSDFSVRKEGIIADKIHQDEMGNLEIKVHPKERMYVCHSNILQQGVFKIKLSR